MPWTPPSNRRRQLFYVVVTALLLVLVLGAAHPRTREYVVFGPTPQPQPSPAPLKEPPPPTFDTLREWIARLPQHDLELPLPEGRTGRYVKFSNEAKYVGWNNCLNERLMNAHLAYMSNRAYVFSDHYWATLHYPWPAAQQPWGGAHTPLPAIVSGPMAGGPWDASAGSAARAISAAWFDVVCPPSERRLINTTDVKPYVPNGGSNVAAGSDIFKHWQTFLTDAQERCVEVVPPPYDVDSLPQVFDLWLWGTERVLSLWEDFRDSPTSRLLGPSPIVQSAIARNMYLFQPRTRVASVQQNHNPFDRMLAVHIRRGDYVQHCHNLAAYGASYYSWAQLPELVDKFTPGQPEEEMMRHCLPSPAQLVQRIEHVRSEYGKVLDVLYLLTNSADEDGVWLDEVKRSLRGWHTLVTTRELILDAEQTEVGMAVDMQLAREAAVFLGNGWSSFTSNIIHQRLVDGRVPLATRLT